MSSGGDHAPYLVMNCLWLSVFSYRFECTFKKAVSPKKISHDIIQSELGLEYVGEQAFIKTYGDREGVANILVLVTEGRSADPKSKQRRGDQLTILGAQKYSTCIFCWTHFVCLISCLPPVVLVALVWSHRILFDVVGLVCG